MLKVCITGLASSDHAILPGLGGVVLLERPVLVLVRPVAGGHGQLGAIARHLQAFTRDLVPQSARLQDGLVFTGGGAGHTMPKYPVQRCQPGDRTATPGCLSCRGRGRS